MKIFIIHGEHTLNSYERLREYIEKAHNKGWEVEQIAGKSSDIKSAILNESLFNKNRLIVLKDTVLLDKKALNWIRSNVERVNSSLLIYHTGTISQKLIKSLPKIEKSEEFKIPKLIWSFLDSFFPGNAKNAYKLFHEVTKNEATEFVFAMLARQIRDIYWAKVDPKTLDYPSWRVAKLKNLASKYRQESLELLIEKLCIIDIDSKTSHANLEKSLDFLIATELE